MSTLLHRSWRKLTTKQNVSPAERDTDEDQAHLQGWLTLLSLVVFTVVTLVVGEYLWSVTFAVAAVFLVCLAFGAPDLDGQRHQHLLSSLYVGDGLTSLIWGVTFWSLGHVRYGVAMTAFGFWLCFSYRFRWIFYFGGRTHEWALACSRLCILAALFVEFAGIVTDGEGEDWLIMISAGTCLVAINVFAYFRFRRWRQPSPSDLGISS